MNRHRRQCPRLSRRVVMTNGAELRQREKSSRFPILPSASISYHARRHGMGHDRAGTATHRVGEEGIEAGEPTSLSSPIVFCVSVERPTTRQGATMPPAASCFARRDAAILTTMATATHSFTRRSPTPWPIADG